MSFKLFLRPRPLNVGILLNNTGTTGDTTISGWQFPFQGLWDITCIGGGGGSGAYSNSHAHSSEAGVNGSFGSNIVYKFPTEAATVTLGGGGLGGQVVGITFNNGDSGNTTTIAGLSRSGGSGGIASTGSPLTSSRSPTWSPNYSPANYNYFLGTSYTYSAAGTSTGLGANGVYGSLVTNLNGSNGNRGAIIVTCVG